MYWYRLERSSSPPPLRRPGMRPGAAYGVFREEAQHLDPQYRPETVNTDGWQATQAAWRSLFHKVTLILCFLHSFLKIRERAVHLKELFGEIGRRVWEAYSAPDARSFSQRLRRLREWASVHVDKEVVREKVLSLCDKHAAFAKAYAHPGCHRTSNLVDRLCAGSITICIAPNISTARRRRAN